jgi:hypothetical protein
MPMKRLAAAPALLLTIGTMSAAAAHAPIAHADVGGLDQAWNSRDIDHPGAMLSQYRTVAHVATDWAQLLLAYQPGITMRSAA